MRQIGVDGGRYEPEMSSAYGMFLYQKIPIAHCARRWLMEIFDLAVRLDSSSQALGSLLGLRGIEVDIDPLVQSERLRPQSKYDSSDENYVHFTRGGLSRVARTQLERWI